MVSSEMFFSYLFVLVSFLLEAFLKCLLILGCSFIFKKEVLNSCLETLYMSNLITGDLTRTGPVFKSPMDVSICRCFVLKQISLIENNLSILYLGLGVCVWGGGGRVFMSKPDCNSSRSQVGEGGKGLYFNMLIYLTHELYS